MSSCKYWECQTNIHCQLVLVEKAQTFPSSFSSPDLPKIGGRVVSSLITNLELLLVPLDFIIHIIVIFFAALLVSVVAEVS